MKDMERSVQEKENIVQECEDIYINSSRTHLYSRELDSEDTDMEDNQMSDSNTTASDGRRGEQKPSIPFSSDGPLTSFSSCAPLTSSSSDDSEMINGVDNHESESNTTASENTEMKTSKTKKLIIPISKMNVWMWDV